MSTAELMKSVSVTALVEKRNAAMDAFARMVTAYCDASDLLAPIKHACPYAYFQGIGVFNHRNRIGADFEMEDLQKRVDAEHWRFMMEETGTFHLMSETARREWDQHIEKGAFPPFTPSNIAATLEKVHDGRHTMFEDGVCDVFRTLNYSYKTNAPVAFGKKLIVEYFACSRFQDPSYETCQKIDDLTRAFHVLDGEPPPAADRDTLRLAREGRSERCFSTPYFDVKWFKKGTAHLTFKRPELVSELNQILHRRWPDRLPPRA